MRIDVGGKTLELKRGDVTLEEVDTVVNAANSQLAGGGGVDGAIHRRGGSGIMAETNQKYPSGCPTGSAVITSGGNLKARYVIHTVGPVWKGGHAGEGQLLQSAYHRCLELAAEHECQSIAFPSLSTGIYRYPIDQASRIALTTAIEFLNNNDRPTLIRFLLFDKGSYGAFAAALEELMDV